MYPKKSRYFPTVIALPPMFNVVFHSIVSPTSIFLATVTPVAFVKNNFALWLGTFETSATIPAWVLCLSTALIFLAAAFYWFAKTKSSRQSIERLVSKRTRELKNENQRIAEQAAKIVSETQQAEWERLTKLNRDNGKLAHDVNNLLQSFSLNIDFLEESPSDIQQVADLIQTNVSDGRVIASKLKSLVGDYSPVTKCFDLNSMIREMSNLIQALGDDGVEVKTECDLQQLWTSGNELEIQRTILNLTLVAKRTAKSWLKVRTGHRTFMEDDLSSIKVIGGKPEPGHFIWVEVSGDGAVAEDEATTYLQTFFAKKSRLSLRESSVNPNDDRSVNRNFRGAKDDNYKPFAPNLSFLATDSFGEIVKTGIRLYFPQSKPPAEELTDGESQLKQAMNDRARKIMIVDHDSTANKSLAAAMKFFKFDVSVCNNASSALDSLKDGNNFDAILVDQTIARQHDANLILEILELEPGTTIFLMAEPSDETDDLNVRADRRVRYLQKPFSVKSLAQRIKSLETPTY